jgi:hypothetical protein
MTLRAKRFSFLLLIVGIVLGLGAGAASFSQRQTRLRGAVDGFPDATLPPRVPILGVNADLTQYDEADLLENLDLMRDTGFVWVRQVFAWEDIERSPGDFDWAVYDQIVDAASQRNLQIVAQTSLPLSHSATVSASTFTSYGMSPT